MTIGVFGTLQIAKESLFTNQTGIAVTSNNIANVNTPGYSRQSAVIETWDTQRVGGLVFGRGAKVNDITKSYDQFLNNSIIAEKSVLGGWEARESSLSEVETVFNESDGQGVNELLNDFWNTWHDVAGSPESLPERTVLQAEGQSLSSKFNKMVFDLKAIQSDANSQIASVIETINGLTTEIASLNSQILGTESTGSNANSLTDKRAFKTEELSKLIDVQVLTQSRNQFTILTSSGHPLVSDSEHWDLGIRNDLNNNNFFNIVHLDEGSTRNLTDKITGGELKGLLDIRDVSVPNYIEKLDFMAASLIAEINKLHYDGYGLDGSSGNYFFQPNDVSLESAVSNTGGAYIYDAEITDPTEILASNFEIKFLSGPPQDSRYDIYDSLNDEYLYQMDAGNSSLVFEDDGVEKLIKIDYGTYTGSQLAAEIEKQMDAVAANTTSARMDYSVSYNEEERSFTFKNLGDSNCELKFSNADTTISRIIGFDETDITLAPIDSVTSDYKSGVYDYASQLIEIKDGTNNVIMFELGGSGTDVPATLTAGTYTPTELALELETQLELETGDDFSVSFSNSRQRFYINKNNGANISYKFDDSSAASTLNFNAGNQLNIAAGTTIASSEPRYSERVFDITEGNNDEIYFSDGGIDTINDIVAKLTEGTYTGEELAEEIEKQMESASGSSGQNYDVTFDTLNGEFSIVNGTSNLHNLDLKWSSSPGAAAALGFNPVDQNNIAAGSGVQSVTTVGDVVSYDSIEIYGFSFKIADKTGLPQRGDVFNISTIQDASENISMDPDTYSDTDKIATALSAIDIDGSNNTIIYDDDGDLSDNRDADGELVEGNYRKIVIPTGRYTPEELASVIEELLEKNNPGDSYAVEYDSETNKFSFMSNPANPDPVTFLWEADETTAAFTLGYSTEIFSITENVNDQIGFLEGPYGDPAIPANTPLWVALTPIVISIDQGSYTGEEMASEIEEKMNDAGTQSYEVSYNTNTRDFTITNTAEDPALNTVLDWDMQETARTLGFLPGENDFITVNGSTVSDYTPGSLFSSGNPSTLVDTSDFTAAEIQVGDNRNAINITDIRDTNVLENGTLTFDSYYNILTSAVGTEVDDSVKGMEHHEYVMSQYEERRASISGVSLDEEMIDLIKYQQAYAVSAKLISTLDQMLNVLVSI